MSTATSKVTPKDSSEIPSTDAHFIFECVRQLDTNGCVSRTPYVFLAKLFPFYQLSS